MPPKRAKRKSTSTTSTATNRTNKKAKQETTTTNNKQQELDEESMSLSHDDDNNDNNNGNGNVDNKGESSSLNESSSNKDNNNNDNVKNNHKDNDDDDDDDDDDDGEDNNSNKQSTNGMNNNNKIKNNKNKNNNDGKDDDDDIRGDNDDEDDDDFDNRSIERNHDDDDDDDDIRGDDDDDDDDIRHDDDDDIDDNENDDDDDDNDSSKKKKLNNSKSMKKEVKNDGKRKLNKSTSSSKKYDDSKDKDYDDSYFKRMHRRAQDKFHDPTDEELFIENLMNNIRGKEFKLCKYRHSSACLVWLLENMNDFNKAKKIIDKISPELLTIEWTSDVNTHAVLECIYDILVKELAKQKDFETETSKWILKWMDGVAKFVVDNLKSFLDESTERENHLLITTMEALGGIRIGRGWNRKNMRFGNAAGAKIDLEAMISGDMIIPEIPQSSKHFLKRIAKTIVLDSPDDECRELIFSRCTSVGLYLLFILRVRYTELCQMVVKKLVEIVFATEEIRDQICQAANGAYIVEIMLLVASESRLSKIWTKYLKANLKLFWRHEISQFIIQRLIDAIKDESLFTDVSQDLFPDLKEIFAIGRSGIGVCLAKNSHDQLKIQAPLVTAMMKAFDAYETKEKQLKVVPNMLFYEPSPNSDRRDSHSRRNFNTHIWLYGSLMLQHMFTYKDPYKLSKSLLAMTTDNIMRTCQDRSGSHVIDSFLQSPDVELKHKSELVERLLGKYHLLACNKYGSRIVENIMKLSNEEVRSTITQELSKKESLLMKNRNGWFVAKNVGIHHFKTRPNDWRDVERGRRGRGRDFGRDFNPIAKHRPSFGGDRSGGLGGRPSFGSHDNRSSPSDRRRDGRRFERGRGMGRRFH